MNNKKRPTILIIDDDKQLSVLVNKILVTKQYQVIIANSFDDVKCWFNDVLVQKQQSADLILLDLLMPKLDGIEMYRWLRNKELTKHIPIIVLTAVDTVSKRVECLGMGANDYIVKPFAMSELLTRIDVHLQLSELRLAKTAAEAQIASQTRFLDVINIISHQAAQHLNLDKMLTGVVNKVTRAFHCHICAIYLFSPETNHLTLSATSSVDHTPIQIPHIVTHAIEQERSIAHDLEAVATIMRDDVIMGALYVANDKSVEVSQEIVQALEILVAQLSTAITNAYLFQDIRQHNLELDKIAKENARLLANEQQQRQQAEQLHRMAQLISSSLDMTDVLVTAIESLRTMMHVERGSLFLLNKDKNELAFTGTLQDESHLTDYTLPANEGIVGQVITQGKPLIVNDVQNHPAFSPMIDEITGNKTLSVLCVPLVAGSEVIGAAELINKINGEFSQLDLKLVESVATSIAIALDNARLYQKQGKLVDEVAHSQAQLLQSEKLAATGRLAASLAHEINNPLQAIHSSLQLAIHFDLDLEKQTVYLNMASEEVERIIDIVTRILDFARPSPAMMEIVDVNKVIGQVIRLTHKHMSHGKWDVHQSMPSDLPLLEAIPDQITQVFMSIMLNAFDAMPDGGSLIIRTNYDDEWLKISFQDTGIGMTIDTQEKIFEPFFSTKEGRSGLGLSISYGIIERHGGIINVSSMPNEGSIFTVCLPIAKSDSRNVVPKFN